MNYIFMQFPVKLLTKWAYCQIKHYASDKLFCNIILLHATVGTHMHATNY